MVKVFKETKDEICKKDQHYATRHIIHSFLVILIECYTSNKWLSILDRVDVNIYTLIVGLVHGVRKKGQR